MICGWCRQEFINKNLGRPRKICYNCKPQSKLKQVKLYEFLLNELRHASWETKAAAYNYLSIHLPKIICELYKTGNFVIRDSQSQSKPGLDKLLGINFQTVTYYLKKYKIPVKEQTRRKYNYEEVLKYHQENPTFSSYQIAKHFGMSPYNVGFILKKFNIKLINPYVKKSEILKQEVIEFCKQHPELSCAKIAKQFGISETLVKNWIIQNKLPRIRTTNNSKQKKQQIKKELQSNIKLSTAQLSKKYKIGKSTINKYKKEIKSTWKPIVKPRKQKEKKPLGFFQQKLFEVLNEELIDIEKEVMEI